MESLGHNDGVHLLRVALELRVVAVECLFLTLLVNIVDGSLELAWLHIRVELVGYRFGQQYDADVVIAGKRIVDAEGKFPV